MNLLLVLPPQSVPEVSFYGATLAEFQGYRMGDDYLEPQENNTVSGFIQMHSSPFRSYNRNGNSS